MKAKFFAIAAVLLFSSSSFVWAQVTASPEHEVLKHDVGVWDAKVKMWMGPGDPQESSGVETNTMVGDFWLTSEFEGEVGGMAFKGHGTSGFDPDSKKYVGTWVDSMSPYVMHMSGTYDKKAKTMSTESSGKDMEGKASKGKSTVVYHDDGSRTMTMFSTVPGSDEMMKTMEIVYTKRKTSTK